MIIDNDTIDYDKLVFDTSQKHKRLVAFEMAVDYLSSTVIYIPPEYSQFPRFQYYFPHWKYYHHSNSFIINRVEVIFLGYVVILASSCSLMQVDRNTKYQHS